MQALSATQLLEIWERGFGRPPAEQALALLAAACPDLAYDTLAGFSIGQRDACLLTLRERLFGPRMEGLVACPACGERLGLDLQIPDIRAARERDEVPQLMSIEHLGWAVRFRLPSAADLLACAALPNADALPMRILERCLLSVRRHGEEALPAQLPDEVVTEIAERMVRADPQAELILSVACPTCGHAWQAILDILSFLWREISAWGYRILYEVHQLASAYGWSEADILALSPWRRKYYLEMAGV